MNFQPAAPRARPRYRPMRTFVPVSTLLLVLLPLLLLPLAAVFVFAFRGGLAAFWAALTAPDAQFALRFSLLIAMVTAVINAVLGTYTAYILSKYRFPGEQARPKRSSSRTRSRSRRAAAGAAARSGTARRAIRPPPPRGSRW